MKFNLYINPNRYIFELRNEFNHVFPFLNLEFVCTIRTPAKKGKEVLHPHQKKIGDCQNNVPDGILQIEDTMRVCDLEKQLEEGFNLIVRVYRKSGNIWIETTITGKWTLQQQNEHGREISTGKIVFEKMSDLDLERGLLN